MANVGKMNVAAAAAVVAAIAETAAVTVAAARSMQQRGVFLEASMLPDIYQADVCCCTVTVAACMVYHATSMGSC
jgi:hypothetical protein